MKIDEAIKLIDDIRRLGTDVFSGDELEALNTAIEILERTRWIPVSEQLPEPYKSVLVCFISRNYWQDKNPVLSTGSWCERAHDGPAWYSYPYGIKANVTHWMPLPEAPRDVK